MPDELITITSIDDSFDMMMQIDKFVVQSFLKIIASYRSHLYVCTVMCTHVVMNLWKNGKYWSLIQHTVYDFRAQKVPTQVTAAQLGWDMYWKSLRSLKA